MAHYLDALRRFSRDVRLYLVCTTLIGFTIFGGIYSVLFNIYLLRLGYGPTCIGMANAAGLLGYAACSLPAGAIGARWGIRRAMVVGMALAVVGNGLQPLAEFLPRPIWATWLVGGALVASFGLALFLVNSNPFLMATTNLAERNHVYSVRSALSPLAAFAGSLVGGALPGLFAGALRIPLSDPAPYRYGLFLSAAILIPGIWALLRTGPVSAPEGESSDNAKEPIPWALIAMLMVVDLLVLTSEGTSRVFFNVYLDRGFRLPTSLIGALSALGQITAVPAALAMPLLTARWGNARTVAFCSWSLALGLLPLALISRWGAAGLGYMTVIALAQVRVPAVAVFQMESVPPRWRGLTSGAVSTALGLSWSLASLGGGYVISALGYKALFLASAGLTLAGAALFTAYFCTPRGKLARVPEKEVNS